MTFVAIGALRVMVCEGMAFNINSDETGPSGADLSGFHFTVRPVWLSI